MNNLEPLIIELFRNDKINYDQTIELIKILKKEESNKVSLKYETKNGTSFYFGIPEDLIKLNVDNILNKMLFKKEENKNKDKDELIENILKIMK